uniref:Uncharacterized protein n=1 Tax=Angiostrongylus cantonensis TaxID=6313 RepID=A0A0K0CTN7_ANGCA
MTLTPLKKPTNSSFMGNSAEVEEHNDDGLAEHRRKLVEEEIVDRLELLIKPRYKYGGNDDDDDDDDGDEDDNDYDDNNNGADDDAADDDYDDDNDYNDEHDA